MINSSNFYLMYLFFMRFYLILDESILSKDLLNYIYCDILQYHFEVLF